MSKPFKAIVENGYQFLQTPGGERVNRLTKTTITQTTEKEAECEFSILVNYNSSVDPQPCKYDPKTHQLTTPIGEVLEVEILKYSPETYTRASEVTARCKVIFPYETNHKQLFESRSGEPFLKTVLGQVI